MQPQGVQESREALHDQKDGYRQNSKYGKNDEDPNESSPALHAKANVHHHGPEHFRQFCKMQEKRSQPHSLSGKCRLFLHHNPGPAHPTTQQLHSQVEKAVMCALGYLRETVYAALEELPARGQVQEGILFTNESEQTIATGSNVNISE